MNILFEQVAEKKSNEETALYASMLMPHLVLARTRTDREQSIGKTLERRLHAWLRCDFEALFTEAKALQQRAPTRTKKDEVNDFKQFDFQMTAGKISNALRSLDDSQKGTVLSLQEKINDKTVMEILKEKHPPPQAADQSYIDRRQENGLAYHCSIFDRINAGTVRKAAMATHGSHGPSGVDADDWRRWLSNFGQSSTNLCRTLASFARRLATEKVNDEVLRPYNACRLIPLDKNPGVRPIGVGEIVRRISARVILKCISHDLKALGGNSQLCLGQKSGIEHAIHSLREKFEHDDSEAMLLIDAKNAFNSLNRSLALQNIELICPSIVTALRNSYDSPSNLYVNGKILISQEGTTQGDPLAMSMYGLALLPLMRLLEDTEITQKWYADDGNAVGKLDAIHRLYKKLQQHGPAFGYHITKCHLVTKTDHKKVAMTLFENLDVELVDGHRVLGSVIGSSSACEKFKVEKANEFSTLLNKLATHAKKSPQNVYHALTKGVQHKLTFLSRTTPNLTDVFENSETIIREKLIPNMTGQNPPSSPIRELLALPLRNGGLNIMTPDDRTNDLTWSKEVSQHLSDEDATNVEYKQHKSIKIIKKQKTEILKSKIDSIQMTLEANQQYSMALASEKGASSWLTALPLKRYGFDLTKTEFRDGLSLRYGLQPKNLPLKCAPVAKILLSHIHSTVAKEAILTCATMRSATRSPK